MNYFDMACVVGNTATALHLHEHVEPLIRAADAVQKTYLGPLICDAREIVQQIGWH